MKESIGLEIGSLGVRAARVSLSRQPELQGFFDAPLPPGVVKEGEIADPEPVANALSEAVKRVGGSKNLVIALANQKVIARIAELPYIPERELAGAIRYQVQDLIPIPMESAVLDFEVLQEFTNEDQERMIRVLVVAAHKEMINLFLETIDRAGLSTDAVDFSPLTLMRSLRGPGGGAVPADREGEALIDVGAELTSMVVRHGQTPKLARVLAVGGNADPGTLVDEIRGSVKFYTGQSEDGSISRAVLSGEAKNLDEVVPLLSDALRLPVQVGNCLDIVKASKKIAQQIESRRQGPLLAVAVGAALGAAGP